MNAKMLTILVPSCTESYSIISFSSHWKERSKQKLFRKRKFTAEILLNILGEKATDLMAYLSKEDISKYDKFKEIVSKEFWSTPQEVLNNCGTAKKLQNKSYVQFASWLSVAFEYNCQHSIEKGEWFKGIVWNNGEKIITKYLTH